VVLVYIHDVSALRRIAQEFCVKFETMCYEDWDSDKTVWLGFTWVESFYYVDPVACTENPACAKTVLEMHLEVFRLAKEGKYSVRVDRRLIKRALRRLAELKKLRRPAT
jgi:hypothetical protein